MDLSVTVEGTGIVDALTLSGFSRFAWTETTPREFNAGIRLNGDLEAIVGGKKINASSIKFREESFVLEGEKKYTAEFNKPADFFSITSGDYYISSVGQLKRYFREQIPIYSEGGVSSWDEIFERVSKGLNLVLHPDRGHVRILGEKNFEKIGGDYHVWEIVKPLLEYWRRPNNELILLETMEPLRIIPLEIRKVGIEWTGKLKAKKVPEFHDPYSIFIDGKSYHTEEFTIYGSGTGEIHFRRGENGGILHIKTPLTIEAAYAKIGTGKLDLYRTERDGQIMHINSVTSEELKDCRIEVNNAPLDERTAELVKKYENRTKNLKLRSFLGNIIFATGGTMVFGSFVGGLGSLVMKQPIHDVTMEAYFGLGLLGAGVVTLGISVYDYTKERSLKQIEGAMPFAKLRLSYSGTQTSRWLEQYPQYLEFAKVIMDDKS